MKPCIIALGKFDGFHKGHQEIIATTISKAKELGLTAAAILFDPLPQALLTEGFKPIQEHNERLKLISDQGLYIHELKIDHSFLNKSAKDFISVLQELQVKAIVVGDDFRFGYQRQGTVELLKQYFAVTIIQQKKLYGRRISSTWCRELIITHKFDKYYELVGRHWQIELEFYNGQITKLPNILLPIGYNGKAIITTKSKKYTTLCRINSNIKIKNLEITGKAVMMISFF